jgi:hypothetical protein
VWAHQRRNVWVRKYVKPTLVALLNEWIGSVSTSSRSSPVDVIAQPESTHDIIRHRVTPSAG